jgi:hypothetical protein
MRRRIAILLAVWAAAACASGNATAPAAAPSPSPTEVVVASPSPTPTPSPIATRIAWPPMAESALQTQIAVRPGIAAAAATPPLVPASAQDLTLLANGDIEQQFISPGYFYKSLQNLRDGNYHGSEPYMFQNTFAPTAFAEQVRTMLQTPHPDETRTFVGRTATVERGWLAKNATMVIEATLGFDDQVSAGSSQYNEGHTWKIRAFRQGGQFYILDGADAGTQTLAPLAPFAPAGLDRELAAQISQHLGQEIATPGGGRPMAMYKGTAYWDARKGALDWLGKLAEQGALTDRHFEGVTAQVTEFTPTSYLGDGIVTVRIAGTLVEVMNGARHTYPVNELVRFQRTAAAQAFWLAVDGQADDGSWLMHGNYTAVPEPMFHG